MFVRRVRGLVRSTLDTLGGGRLQAAYRPVASSDKPRSVLFLRSIRSFSGGHLKTWDYYNHVRESRDFAPFVCFTRWTLWGEENPWFGNDLEQVPVPSKPDAIFIGGQTWRLIPPKHNGADLPVINLVQHVRHADPDDPRFRFLDRKAIRICVSPEVAEAITRTGRVRGPIITIPNGIDIDLIRQSHPQSDRDIDLLVLATKQPVLGRRLAKALETFASRIRLIDETIPRSELLHAMRRSRVALLLPNRTEGFYLPALEAMALGAVVVCPDCVGNRSFCIDGRNALRPPYDDDQIEEAAKAALQLSSDDAEALTTNGAGMAEEHGLTRERERFLDVLDRLDELWRS